MIILGAQQEVDEQNGNGSTGDDHNTVAEEEEAEHVVDLSKPHVIHDEIKFDEDGAKGEESNKCHGGQRPKIGI